MSDPSNLTTEQAMKMLYERNEQLARELQALRMEQQQALIHIGNNQKGKGLKPPPPDVFKGPSVDTFLFSIEKAFEYYEIGETKKVSIAVNYFRDSALRWFKFMERQFQDAPPTWNEFKKLLIQHFKAANTETVVRNKLNSLHQTGSVSNYSDAFNRLIIELPEIDEKTKIDMYCRGLKQQVQLHVSLQMPESLSTAQSVAMNVDNIIGTTLYGKGRMYSRNGNASYRSVSQPISASNTPMELGYTEQDEGYSAEKEEQVAAVVARYQGSNKLSNEEVQKLRKEKKCFKCKKIGHIARHCPNMSNF
jgi:Ty3 transposon capsid-like protein/Zinc knuckle